jgi:ATP-binding protein involved in chromosome partitioning
MFENRKAIPGVANIVAVYSTKGGVGKSTVTALIAKELAGRGKKVGVLDADIYGPSQAELFNLDPSTLRLKTWRESEKTKPLLIPPMTKEGIAVMSFGFLTASAQPLAWRGPMLSKAFEQISLDVKWPELDVLFVDMPPGTGDIAIQLLESLPVQQSILVTLDHPLAWADVKRGVTLFEEHKVGILGCVVNMSGHSCQACGHKSSLFGSSDTGNSNGHQELRKKIGAIEELAWGEDLQTVPLLPKEFALPKTLSTMESKLRV